MTRKYSTKFGKGFTEHLVKSSRNLLLISVFSIQGEYQFAVRFESILGYNFEPFAELPF
jgi:hypothetical protein